MSTAGDNNSSRARSSSGPGTAAPSNPKPLPSHKQLLLPVLQAIDHLGGEAQARDVVEAVADHLEVPRDVREQITYVGNNRPVNVFARRVRWVRQDAVRRGFVSGERFKLWELTKSGADHLKNCRPGIVITIYETECGTALWGEAEAAAGVIGDSTISLILTSPPYPLLKQKAYGNLTGQAYLDWLVSLAGEWRRMLVDDGSLVLNVGPTWQRGVPTQSLYQERLLIRLVDELGFHLAQRFYWENPGKIASSEWVTIRRVRVRNVIEDVYWLSKTPHPKADNRKVLREYSARMKKLIARGGEYRRLRPSGHGDTRGAFGRDNGGSIPTNLISAANSASSDFYHRMCREHGLPPHPATFPQALPEFFISMLSDPGDIVYDPFGGSNNIGPVCERLGREWIVSERSLSYLSGSKFRFDTVVNSAPHLCPIS